MTFGHCCQKGKKIAVCRKKGGGGTNENLLDFSPLSTGMPPTSTNTHLPMLITRNIKLSKLKIISSPSTRYYTILQTQTREKKSGSKKCTTALVLYKTTSRNDWQWSTKFMFSYHRHSTAGFYLSPSLFLVRAQQPRQTEHTVYLVRTARDTWHCVPGRRYKRRLCTVVLRHVSCQDHSRSKIKWQLDLIN